MALSQGLRHLPATQNRAKIGVKLCEIGVDLVRNNRAKCVMCSEYGVW